MAAATTTDAGAGRKRLARAVDLRCSGVDRVCDVTRTDALIKTKLDEAMVNAKKSIRIGLRAWIDPKGNVYPLRIMGNEPAATHPEWIMQNQGKVKKHLVRTGFFGTGDIDAQATMSQMMRRGWIKKDSPTTYQTGRGHLQRAADHFRSHHPNRHEAKIIAHHSDGETSNHRVGHAGPITKWGWS